MDENIKKRVSKDHDYFLFLGSDEQIVFEARGILGKTINGILLLTDKKLFFFYRSNLSRDKVFIATHPYIVSVLLKEGLFKSTLVIENRNESFTISKINKNKAREFYEILDKISRKNRALS